MHCAMDAEKPSFRRFQMDFLGSIRTFNWFDEPSCRQRKQRLGCRNTSTTLAHETERIPFRHEDKPARGEGLEARPQEASK